MTSINPLLKLPSGFILDFSNALGDQKVSSTDLYEINKKIHAAYYSIERMRATGEVAGHLSKDGTPEKVLFTTLPFIEEGNLNSPSSIDAVRKFGESLRYHTDTVISFGIGGSYLGSKVLFDLHCGDFWNCKSVEERNGYPKFLFSGNNMDPRRTTDLIEYVVSNAKREYRAEKPYRVVLVVISKSGSTIDTMATFMVVYEAIMKAAPYIEVTVAVVTDTSTGENETLLHRLAIEQRWTVFPVPDGVGGRFSVFSEVGLITAACIGFDIEAFLAGARGMDEACRSENVQDNPALFNAAVKYLAATKYRRAIEVFMPYADNLKSVAEWYVQLLAESLGKRNDRDGHEVYYGRTPVVAVGTTDMHAQTQLHQDGPKDKMLQFVRVMEWDEKTVIPNVFPTSDVLSNISGINLGCAMDAAREANAEALARDGRFNATFELPRLNAFHLGELLYLLALSVAYEGELANVDAFDQPGVETYKRLMGPKLKACKMGFSGIIGWDTDKIPGTKS